MVTNACNPRTWESEAGGLPLIGDQPGLPRDLASETKQEEKTYWLCVGTVFSWQARGSRFKPQKPAKPPPPQKKVY